MRNLLLLFIALFGFGYAQAQDCTGADHTVLAGNYYYNPTTLTVTAGESIAFLNEGGFHNVNGVTSSLGATWNNPESFSLGANSGASEGVCMGTVTLSTPGTYQYDCSIGSHAANGMVGTIVVEAAASTTPTDNAGDPTLDAGDVVSVYGGSYDSNGTNFNPGWGQSGTVNTDFDPGTGNVVMEYANFNYQGTDISAMDLSGMTHLHVDVWVAADNDRMLKVSPINGGTGAGEFLVEVPLTPGAWNSVDLTKAAFDGMTWDNVFQMKFDGQFNADGAANGAGWDVYLDNIYFWNDGTGSGPPSGETVDVTFTVNMENETVSSDGVSLAGGTYFGFPGDNPMSDNGDGTWSITIGVPVGFTGNYTFTNGGAACGWNCKENIEGQSCADGQYNDRLLSNITEATNVNTCFGECTTDGSCSAPATQYNVTFQVDMSNAGLDGSETIYATGSHDGWCGPCDNVLTDNGSGIFTRTISLDPGSYEFKYMINAWGGDEQNILGTACDFLPGDGNGNRGFTLGEEDLVLPVQCFDFCGTCEEQNNQGTVNITWNVNMSNEVVSADGVHLAGGGFFGNPGDNPLTDNGDSTWSITMTVAEGFSSYYIFTNGGAACSWDCKENLAGLPCGDPGNFNDRYIANVTQDTTMNFCFGECGTDGICVGNDGGGDPTDPTGPTDNAADPTLDAGDVVSIYGGSYDNIATNYNPGWGQSGTVNDAYDPGTGNMILQYANFNYQGTELSLTDLSGMTHIHMDVWVAADNSRMLKMSPINTGTGATEFLVEVPLTPGAWNSVDLTKAAFEGMSWDGVFQMKFDGQFDADGAANGAGWDVYLDNIYFWNDGTGSGPPSNDTYDVTFNVNTSNITVGPNGMYLGGGNYFGDAQGHAMSDSDEDGTYTVIVAVPAGYTGNYVFLNSPNDGGDWGAKENLVGLPCADGPFSDRLLAPVNSDTTLTTCFEQCTTDGSCEAPATTYAVTFQVDMADAGLVGDEVIYVTGSFDGWCGPCDNVLTDEDGDDVYTGMVNLVPGDYEFKYMINAWGGDEQNIGGTACDFIPTDEFGNRGFTLGEADLVLDVNCFDVCGPCEDNGGGGDPTDSLAVTFNVDMNNYGGTFGIINVSGTWNDFCADCNQMTDEDLDGVWTATINLPQGNDYRYKYQVDSWSDQEELAPGDDQVGPCVVKEGGFTNRDLDVAGSDPMVLDVVCWQSCLGCIGAEDVAGCNDATAANYDETATANDGSCMYDVTFSVNMNEYPLVDADSVYVNGSFNGWCGACNPLLDEDEDGIYTTTISLAYDFYEYKFTVNAWNAEENLAGLEGCVTENFGFTNRVLQLFENQSQDLVCWNSCSDCEGSGEINGCTDEAASNYSELANNDDGSCEYPVTFVVDMNEYVGSYTTVNLNGGFADWCGACIEMTDDNSDNVYEVTANIPAGVNEYKFTVDGWSDQEIFAVGTSCTSTIDGFTNRTLTVTGAATLDVVCWNSCYACDVATGCTDADALNYDETAIADDGSCSYSVTLRLDMSTSSIAEAGVHVAGAFQGWDPGSTPMSTPGLDLYEYTVQLTSGSYQYIYINGNGWEGQETVQAECGVDNGQGGLNREFTVAGSSMVLDVVCFGSCSACAGCTDPLSAEFSPFAGEDDGSCATPLVFGCTYPDADNYNAAASSEDGSCIFSGASDCPTDIDGDGSTAVGDLLVILGAFGQTCD